MTNLKLQALKALRERIPIGYQEAKLLIEKFGTKNIEEAVDNWIKGKVIKIVKLTKVETSIAQKYFLQSNYEEKKTIVAIEASKLGLTASYLFQKSSISTKLYLIAYAIIDREDLANNLTDQNQILINLQIEGHKVGNKIVAKYLLVWAWLQYIDNTGFVTDGLYWKKLPEIIQFLQQELQLMSIAENVSKAKQILQNYQAQQDSFVNYFAAAHGVLLETIEKDMELIEGALLEYVIRCISHFPE